MANGGLINKTEQPQDQQADLKITTVPSHQSTSNMEIALAFDEPSINAFCRDIHGMDSEPVLVRNGLEGVDIVSMKKKIKKEMEKLKLQQQSIHLYELEKSLGSKATKLDTLQKNLRLAAIDINDFKLTQSAATHAFTLTEAEWQSKHDIHQQFFQRAHESLSTDDLICAATAEADAAKLRCHLLERRVDIMKLEAAIQSREVGNHALEEEHEVAKADFQKLGNKVLGLKARLDTSWKTWNCKWDPHNEALEDIAFGDLDGDESDSDQMLATDLKILKSKDHDAKSLKSAIQVAEMQRTELSAECKMLRGTINTLQMNQARLLSPEEFEPMLQSLKENFEDLLSGAAIQAAEGHEEVTRNARANEAESRRHLQELQDQVRNLEAGVLSEEKAKCRIESLQQEIDNLKLQIDEKSLSESVQHAQLINDENLTESLERVAPEDQDHQAGASELGNIQQKLPHRDALLEAEKKLHADTKAKLHQQANENREKIKQLNKQSVEKVAKEKQLKEATKKQDDLRKQIINLELEVAAQKRLVVNAEDKASVEAQKREKQVKKLDSVKATNEDKIAEIQQDFQKQIEKLQAEFVARGERFVAARSKFIEEARKRNRILNSQLGTASKEKEDMIAAASKTLREVHEHLDALAAVGAAVRNRELENVLSTTSDQMNRDVIANGNRAAHEGDAVADALLYTTQSSGTLDLIRRTDSAAYAAHYGINPDLVLMNRSSTRLITMLNYNYLVNSFRLFSTSSWKNHIGSAVTSFEWYFWHLLPKFLPQEGMFLEKCLELDLLGITEFEVMKNWYETVAKEFRKRRNH